ncbi:HNH endonuclease [Dictyobacter arantiisoli]|uniref:HNH endonuclease n=1 Tax=Dictyobacter arantiisoli TaxID=2014874 RepID=A0A5A5T6H7_9CHLR|nr:HNH endonuclease [Dictyobacter arantiisoli]GCF06968.1 hypothetical protein KDI_05320 [Dictyobacter arantiisoli]
MEKKGKWLILWLLSILLLSGCTGATTQTTKHSTTKAINSADTASILHSSQAIAPLWGHRTKTSHCHIQGSLPDPACTPGNIMPGATADTVCVPGYTRTVRNVSVSTKNRVYAEYGITQRSPGQYQIDHFISLGSGGANDISNLWPQPATPLPGYHEKDRLERYLYTLVCNDQMSLKDAQIQMATNWVAAYQAIPKNWVADTSKDPD